MNFSKMKNQSSKIFFKVQNFKNSIIEGRLFFFKPREGQEDQEGQENQGTPGGPGKLF